MILKVLWNQLVFILNWIASVVILKMLHLLVNTNIDFEDKIKIRVKSTLTNSKSFNLIFHVWLSFNRDLILDSHIFYYYQGLSFSSKKLNPQISSTIRCLWKGQSRRSLLGFRLCRKTEKTSVGTFCFYIEADEGL